MSDTPDQEALTSAAAAMDGVASSHIGNHEIPQELGWGGDQCGVQSLRSFPEPSGRDQAGVSGCARRQYYLVLNVLRNGECFGEMAYLGKQKFQRSASVAALTEATVLEIRAETLPKASEPCRHHFDGAFLELLVDRLSAADLGLSQLLTDKNVSVY